MTQVQIPEAIGESASGQRQPPVTLRRNFSWTLVGNVVYAGCQWAMLMLLAKLGTPEMVGQFALGLAITAPVILLSNLQLRGIQATDAAGDYRFGDYLGLRLVTTVVAVGAIICIVLAGGYRPDTAVVVLLIGVAKAIESISDILYGSLQQHERFDRIAKSMIIKGALSLGALGAGVYLSGRVIWGIVGLAVVWLVLLLAYDVRSVIAVLASEREVRDKADTWRMRLGSLRPHWGAVRLGKLTILALPMGASMMLLSLNTNIPRYAIQHYLGEHQLGIFAALAYTITVGTTIVGALGQSASPRLARHYAERELAAFRSLLAKLLMIGVTLGGVGIALALAAGHELLLLIYAPEYAGQTKLLIMLMITAAVGYSASFLGYAVTAARCFKPQLPLSITVAGATTLACIALIPRQGLLGAAWALIIAAVVQLFGTLLILIAAIRRGSSSTVSHTHASTHLA